MPYNDHFRVYPFATGTVVYIGPKRVPVALTNEVIGDFWLLEGEIANIDPINAVSILLQDMQATPITLFSGAPCIVPPGGVISLDSQVGRLFSKGLSWQAGVADKLDGWLIGIKV